MFDLKSCKKMRSDETNGGAQREAQQGRVKKGVSLSEGYEMLKKANNSTGACWLERPWTPLAPKPWYGHE